VTTPTLPLPDGRLLAYQEFGDPGGYPTFYFHGTPGSRLEGAFGAPAAARLGFRLIAVDRPGFGRSTFQRGRRFVDWPGDVRALADALGLDRFGAVGHSGGGPHLFACGSGPLDGRLRFIGALGPWGPAATREILADLNRLDRWYARLSQHRGIMRAAFAPLSWSARHWPGLFLGLMRSAVSPGDREALEGDLLAELRASELEAFRQGGRGGAHEARIAYQEWGFALTSVRVPTHIWLGEEDIFVPPAMGRYLERTIPGVDFHWIPHGGHFAVDRWDDILAACAPHR
jgi:pimeloyl-ACP methyl ester carboxylesterase